MTRIDQRFDAVDRRFDAIERRIDALEDRMDRNFERVWTEFGQIHRLLAQIGWGVAGLLLIQMIVTVVAISLR